MTAKIVLFITISLLSSWTYAGKLYKTVDENGNVTFSQIPPQNSGAKVEEMQVNSGATTRVSTKLGKQYCGDIQLPSNSNYGTSSSKYYSRNIEYSLENWKETLARLGENTERRSQNKLNQNNNRYYSSASSNNQRNARYVEEQNNDMQRMRDLRCAIEWAESKMGSVREYAAEDNQEKARLEEIAQKLETDLDNTCGPQPTFDPSDEANEYRRKRWYECSKEFVRNLQKVRQRIDRL